MTYDYSRAYLERNAETVQGLIECFVDKTTFRAEFKQPEDLRASQRKVTNLLASIAFHMDEYREIRATIRTWTAYEHEHWVLYVGRPPAGIGVPGRPKARIQDRQILAEKIPWAQPRNVIGHLEFTKRIGGVDTWNEFQFFVAGAAPDVTAIKAHFLHPVQDVTAFEPFQSLGWFLADLGDDRRTITLHRLKEENNSDQQ